MKGRINYITSSARQENLYAVCETCERPFWWKLARENQNDFQKSGTAGSCIEARELIIALPESFTKYEPNELLREYTEHFKSTYGVECVAALHHNKAKTNYHIHLIFSERKRLEEPVKKIASRNMFYDERGKHVRTRKEILDENGEIRAGCKIIPKGEIYEQHFFDKKISVFKQKSFLEEVKNLYVEKINEKSSDTGYMMTVFDRKGPYLPMKKIGKNNPKADFIKENNKARIKWNTSVSKALHWEIPAVLIIAVKKSEVMKPMREVLSGSRDKGTALDAMTKIIARAAVTLINFMNRIIRYKLKEKLKPDTEMFHKVLADSRKVKKKEERER